MAVSAAIALLALAAWWLFAHVSVFRAIVVVIVTTPLLFALPRLWIGERRAYAWTTLAVIPYFVFAITEAVANPPVRVWASACLAIGFMLFITLIAYLRTTR